MEICRTCFGTSSPLFPLFSEENYPDKIKILADIDVTEDNSKFPKSICKTCIENISRFLEFRTKIQQCTKTLENIAQEIRHHTPDTENSANMVKIEYIVELSEEDDQKIEIKAESKQEKTHVKSTSKQRKICLSNIINTAIPKSTIYKCEKCNQYSTESRYNLYKHLIYKVCEPDGPIKHPELPVGLYSCDECQYITDIKVYLTKHKQVQHKNKKSCRNNNNSDQEVPCKICGKLMRKKSLLHHMKTHKDRVDCPICNKSYTSGSLRSHVIMHKKKDCVCEVCGKVFEYEGLYKNHMVNHTKVKKRHKCTICNLVVYSLKKHMRSHTGERPHMCEICGKGLSSVHALKHHLRIHKDERPFKCTLCDSSFRVKVCLTKHLKSRHKLM